MNREYDLKDILTEAVRRDFEDLPATEWIQSEKHKKFKEQLFSNKKTGKDLLSSGLFKGISVAAAVVLLFGIAMVIKPIREPLAALFGTVFGKTERTDTDVFTETGAIETDTVTEKSVTVPDTTDKTAKEEITDEVTEYKQKTTEDWVDVLVEAIAKGDNSDIRWETLHFYGDVAFDHLVNRYFNGEKDPKVKSVISVFISEMLSDEVNSCEALTTASYPERAKLDTVIDIYKQWLLYFRSCARTYMNNTLKEDALRQTPLTCRFLSLVGYDSYKFDSERASVEECAKRLIAMYPSENFGYLSEDRKNEVIEYYVKNYFTETDVQRRVCMSWLVFVGIGRWEMQDLVGYDLVSSFYRYGEYNIPENSSEFKSSPKIVEPIIEKYAAAAKEAAKNLYKEEAEHDFPGTYALLSAVGFDDYKPEPFDTAYRSRGAIKAAAELYRAVNYGVVPEELRKCCLPVEDYMREELTERTKEDVYSYCPSEDFFNYFEKYIDRPIIDAALTDNAWFTVKSGRVYMFDGGAQNELSIDHRSAKLLSQNGDTAVITADVSFPSGMFSFIKTLTFEIKEYNDGIRITGGQFAERVLSSQINDAAFAASYVAGAYCILYEGQIEYNYMSRILSYGGPYDSIDSIPEEYRNRIKADAEFPAYLTSTTVKDFVWLKRYTTEEVYDTLTKENGVYDGDMAVFPKYAKTKTLPAFEHGYTIFDGDDVMAGEFITSYDFLLAMNVIDVSDDTVTFSLDFTREENGVKKDVTYTFAVNTKVLTHNDQYGDTYVSKLVGGTFLTDVIMAE